MKDQAERVRDWLIASDPGLLRFQMAATTTVTLVVSLGVLYAITKAFDEPITVALLGVVIAMLSSAAVNDPDPRQQRIAMLSMPLPAAAAVTLGALLAPHKVVGDVVFVAIMFTAVYIRRFGSRGMALGMVAFISYFFSLFLGATVSMLPWLIIALVIGTACSFVMRTYVLRDHPERTLRRTLRGCARSRSTRRPARSRRAGRRQRVEPARWPPRRASAPGRGAPRRPTPSLR